jgi:DNA-directed RNA polymerase subunit beta'
MLRRIRVVNPGDSDFMPAELVDERDFREKNNRLLEEDKSPSEGRTELMGITKASLATDSWLSAASFQETTKVLTDAAIFGKSDYMRGLKENVIIGRLIPAGTGAADYQSLVPSLPGATTVASLGWEMPAREEQWTPEDAAQWLRSVGTTNADVDLADAGDEAAES